MKNTTRTKTASAKKAPKFKTITRELGKTAELAAIAILADLPTKLLAPMCKAHDVPVAKYKEDMVERLARKLIREIGRRVIVKIL